MTTFKTNDNVFYYRPIDNTFETISAKVLKVTPKKLKIEADFNEGKKIVTISKENCILQKDY